MANILGKDPAEYAKERDSFLRDLHHFHDTRGTPFRRCPKINGFEIDLYLLYSLVTAHGGWIKVNTKNEWPSLFANFGLLENCVNAGVALKQLYLRYLDRWEKVHFLGEEADRGSDDDEESRHKRWSARALHSVPLSYNYQQHNIAESIRDYNNLSTNLYKQSDYDRLNLSLQSPLPNEQDFAINVCTLLSNDGKHTLKLDKYPRMVNHLVAHAGVFNHSSLRSLYTHYYATIRKRPQSGFWKDVVSYEEFLELENETVFVKTSGEDERATTLLSDSTIKVDEVKLGLDESKAEEGVRDDSDPSIINLDADSDSDCCEVLENKCDSGVPRRRRLKRDPVDRELFCLGRTLGTQDYFGQRVLQVATILRNLSFIDENIPVLAANETFVRFALLCASSRWGNLHNLGLDMLGNVSSEFHVKDAQSDKLSSFWLRLVTKGVQSENRSFCITALEVLNKLSQTEVNEDYLARNLEPIVYQKVCSFLTLHDVMLLIYTLECLYSLSSLGERACNLIVGNHGVLDTLVSLVTVEGKSYGPKACIGMKIVETVPGASATGASSNNSSAASTSTSATSTTTSSTLISTPGPIAVQATPVKSSVQQSTPTRTVQIAPQRLIITPTSTVASSTTVSQITQIITTQQLVQQQHAHQQAIQENEQFALTWLRATYEPCSNGRVEQQELYKQYINSCAKIGRRGVIAPLHFPRCVRSVFGGSVGPNPSKSSNSNDSQYYEGIKVRAQPLVISVQPASNSSTTPQTPVKGGNVRRQGLSACTTPSSSPPPITLITAESPDVIPTSSPASPILKAQLSAPSKTREPATPVGKTDTKSQVMAHPHLSQALLGSSINNSTSGNPGSSKDSQTNTSLIKSLLATKVNDCMPTAVSMKTTPVDCQSVVQVAARQQQQRMLSQQILTPLNNKSQLKPADTTPKSSRINGARQLFADDMTESSVSSTTAVSNFSTGKREPPQPPPPPLAPLSNPKSLTPRPDEDSNSTGNNSLASSSGINVGISSTEDGENSLTSFEGLLNGVPSIDPPVNDDSNSKDSLKSTGVEITKNKPLMLADLLEKKVDKDPPLLNGLIGKELRIGEKGLELVENHIEKVLSKEHNITNKSGNDEGCVKQGVKRSASEAGEENEAKRPHLSNNMNGTSSDSSISDPTPNANGEEGPATVSTAAAKLFADIAADILEDEEEEELMQVSQSSMVVPTEEQQNIVQVVPNNVQQIVVDNTQQQVLVPQTRQIIVSQPQIQATNQVVLPSGAQIKTGQTVIVQNAAQPRPSVVLQSTNQGQFLLSSGLQGQMQLVASTTQPGQYLLQTGSTQGAYVMAQSQTAVVHGQPQTVLVTQTPQQQGTGTKTIIILQQPSSSSASHQQKVIVTPQGQPVVVTPVQRPLLQAASTVSNVVSTSANLKTTSTTVITQSISSTVAEKKVEEPKTPPKPRINRDTTTPFVCEWGECQVETKFKSANQVFMHVCETHCPESTEELTCLWDRCDNMKRKRFSLMTHINDKHCNTEAMKQSQIKRKQQSQSGKVDPPTPAPVTPHPGYAPDAALHAIKRHALEFVNPKELQRSTKQGATTASTPMPRSGPTSAEQDDNEGPVTKSIRLTASLILRNLVIYSNNCRRYLRHYEPHLANVALSNVESSRTVAQILYDMSDSAR